MRSKVLRQVAEQLFDRYQALSGGESPRPLYRTIVVVGAGASYAACGLPLAKDLADKIQERLAGEHIPRRLFENEQERLEMVYRMRPDDFETRLLALSRFDPTTVIEELRSECDFTHYPSLTYEILAHLFKHGFLDAIVNFNFDELLDQAIEEEVGTDQYVRIVRDGDWSRLLSADTDDPYRFDRPLYIKPHGTVSDPASLRFTREAYFALPLSTRHLLRILLQGAPIEAFFEGARAQSFSAGAVHKSGAEVRGLCMIVLGHGLGSIEFNKLLEHIPKSSHLHVLCWDDAAHAYPMAEWPPAMCAAAEGRFIPIADVGGTLDTAMDSLWTEIERQAELAVSDDKSWLQVRGIARHRLIAHLFAPTRPGMLLRRDPRSAPPDQRADCLEALRNYFDDRFIVELALAIAKAKGFCDGRELNRGRPGRFYALAERTGGVSKHQTLASYLVQFGMERRDAASMAYMHKSVPPPARRGGNRLGPDRPQGGQHLTWDRPEFKEHASTALLNTCRNTLTSNRIKKWNNLGTGLFAAALDEMFSGGEVEIATQRSGRPDYRFETPRAIRTVAGLHRETISLLRDPNWCVLLCVAESGGWLLNDVFQQYFRLPGRTIAVIVADDVMQDQLRQLAAEVRIECLPWHLHNRHLTLRLRESNGALVPDGAIYLERRYRSSLISPVLLKGEADLQEVLNDFTIYWLKAQRHKCGESEVINCTSDHLQLAREKMLAEVLG